MAGAESGMYLTEVWMEAYSAMHCPDFKITFETNSWDAGAARVCASSLLYGPIDMASMQGPFFQPQAYTENGWKFQCKNSQLERETILVSYSDVLPSHSNVSLLIDINLRPLVFLSLSVLYFCQSSKLDTKALLWDPLDTASLSPAWNYSAEH